MVADLHLHTSFSDGTYSPEELVQHAHAQSLGAIALTDHDTVEGCERAGLAASAAGLEFIPGTELTAEHQGEEIHILGYFIDTHHEPFLAQVARFQEVRQNRIREMVARVNEHDIPLRAEDVFRLANCRAPGRPHVARALVAAGHCGSLDEAFERFLKKGRPAWVPKFKISASDAIRLIHEAGGAAVLAHPGLNRVDHFIPAMVGFGLDGLECLHTKHSPAVAEHYLAMARQMGLVITGGSDCHGHSKGRPLIGTVRLPYPNVERLKAKAGEYQRGPAAAEDGSFAH